MKNGSLSNEIINIDIHGYLERLAKREGAKQEVRRGTTIENQGDAGNGIQIVGVVPCF